MLVLALVLRPRMTPSSHVISRVDCARRARGLEHDATSMTMNDTYRMSSVLGAIEVNHAINARKGCAAALAAVGVEFLFGENITTTLRDTVSKLPYAVIPRKEDNVCEKLFSRTSH